MADIHSMRTEQAELSREEIYRDWLGLNTAAPSYYGLLGVPELESDETAIHHAARRVKRKLRAYQIGLYRKQALEVLSDVGQAVSVLTNPEKKRAYNNDLVRRWRATIEELFQTHCKGAIPEPASLEVWLSACQSRGIPVARLMPRLMRTLQARFADWPRQGEAGLALPISIWIYRDVIVLGQCLHVGTLEKRVEAVKHVQKLLGIPPGLAALMAEEVARGLHLFAHTRIVTQAQKDADAVLLRLGRRIRRFGGRVGHRSKVLAASAMLLGKHKRDMEAALARLDELPVELTAAQKAACQARRARDKVGEAGHKAKEAKVRAAEWLRERPQILVGAALVLGLVALVLAFLVAAGIWEPFAEESPAPSSPDTLVKQPAPGASPRERPRRPFTVERTPAITPPDQVTSDLLPELKELQEFIEKGGETPNLPPLTTEKRPPPGTKPPVLPIKPPGPNQKPPPKETPSGEIKFFGVDGAPAAPEDRDTSPDSPPNPPAAKPKKPAP